ncbi:hypothetical protein FJZ31_20975 [Candidatus Poribacteria bacterium]|nr:hypothetical protein [Candidatus Poribacteria bacterium]
MAKKQRRWVYSPPKQTKPKVPESTKEEVEKRAKELVEHKLKPEYIKPPPQDNRFNYIVDLYTKWYRNSFYFCSKYHSPGPNAISPFFESKFARMEYVGDNKFNLSYMRYTGQWLELYEGLSLEECLTAIENEPHFIP